MRVPIVSWRRQRQCSHRRTQRRYPQLRCKKHRKFRRLILQLIIDRSRSPLQMTAHGRSPQASGRYPGAAARPRPQEPSLAIGRNHPTAAVSDARLTPWLPESRGTDLPAVGVSPTTCARRRRPPAWARRRSARLDAACRPRRPAGLRLGGRRWWRDIITNEPIDYVRRPEPLLSSATAMAVT